MFNPWVILGIVLLWLASLAGVGYWQNGAGVDKQKIVDQKEFDKINEERTQQKTDANTLYRKAQADIIALQGERDKLKTQLEVNDAKNRKVTADLAAKYAGVQLRFAATQSPGHWPNGSCANGTGTDAAGAGRPIIVEQLPDKITSDLRQLVIDGDKLRDEYAKCYGYATKVK